MDKEALWGDITNVQEMAHSLRQFLLNQPALPGPSGKLLIQLDCHLEAIETQSTPYSLLKQGVVKQPESILHSLLDVCRAIWISLNHTFQKKFRQQVSEHSLA